MLYSEAAPPDIKSALSRIGPPEGCAHFGTARLQAMNGSEVCRTSWLEAHMNPQTKLWMLQRHEEIGNACSQKTIHRAVQFFDALYECAKYETTEKLNSGINAANGDLPHYTATGNLAFIPFDMAGIPHPSVDGLILTDGLFEKTQKDIGRNSRLRDPQSSSPVGDIHKILEETASHLRPNNEKALKSGAIDAHKRTTEETKLNGHFAKAMKLAQAAGTTLQKAVRNSFSSTLMPEFNPKKNRNDLPNLTPSEQWNFVKEGWDHIGPGVFFMYPIFFFCGCLPVNGFRAVRFGARAIANTVNYAAGGDAEKFPEKAFAVLQKDLRAELKHLPDGSRKTLLQEFSKAADAAFVLEYIACLNKTLRANNAPERKFKSFLKAAEKSIDGIKLQFTDAGEDTAQRLRVALYQDKFPAPGTFLEKMVVPRQNALTQGVL